MARLLRDLDYLRVIQEDNLSQIIESNQQIRQDVEQAAQAEMISYLAQRYIVSKVFTNTAVFSLSDTYKAKNLVEWSETAWASGSTYTAGQRVSFTPTGSVIAYIYQAVSNTSAGESPNTQPAKWNQITENKALYYVKLPNNEWNKTTTYAVNDQVWYEDKVYTCLVANKNIVPSSNTTIWGTGSSYTVTNALPNDATKWTKGDNRNQQIVLHLLDITLYHLHSRINPRNIPDLRKERYDGNGPNQTGGAVGWLKRVASGDVTADLPQIDPEQGLSIRWGNADGTTTRSSNFY